MWSCWHGFVKRRNGHLSTVHRSLGPPLFSFLCAGIYAIVGHSFLAVLLVQVASSAVLSLVVYRIGAALFGTGCGLIACGLASFHPGLAYYSVRQVHPLIIDATLIAFVYWCALCCLRDPRKSLLTMLGLTTGVCILTRPTITFFLPLVAALVLYRHRARWRDIVPHVLLAFVGAGVIVLPWTVRNWQVHKELVYITTDTGELLWRGNHEGASGYGLAPSGEATLDEMPEEFKKRVWALDELGQKDFFMDLALEFIGDNPGQFALLTIRKGFYFWWFYPQSGAYYPALYLRIYQVIYSIGLLFGLVGLVVGWRHYPQARYGMVLLLLLFAVIWLSQSLFYVNIRHRWGIEALGGILTALGMSFLGHRVLGRIVAK